MTIKEHPQRTILETSELWDNDFISDNWEQKSQHWQWPLNKEWQGQHSQFLRCFVLLLGCFSDWSIVSTFFWLLFLYISLYLCVFACFLSMFFSFVWTALLMRRRGFYSALFRSRAWAPWQLQTGGYLVPCTWDRGWAKPKPKHYARSKIPVFASGLPEIPAYRLQLSGRKQEEFVSCTSIPLSLSEKNLPAFFQTFVLNRYASTSGSPHAKTGISVLAQSFGFAPPPTWELGRENVKSWVVKSSAIELNNYSDRQVSWSAATWWPAAAAQWQKLEDPWFIFGWLDTNINCKKATEEW